MKEWYSEWFVQRSEVFSSLADTLEQAIRSGRLAPGDRLPTHRDLSKRLGVAVSTVSRAYAEATRRGLIDGTVGRGTFVLPTGRENEAGGNREGLRPLERLYLPLMQREDAINLSLNEPLSDGTGDRLRHALEAVIAKGNLNDLAHYQPLQGQLEHREAGAAWLRELGVDVAVDDVYAVSGGQTALMTIFLGLARPGDTVLTEELTWPGALSVGRLTGIRLMPVAIDQEGMVPEAFDAACQTLRPRFVYTMPTLHNPTNGHRQPRPAPGDRAHRARSQCADRRRRCLRLSDRAAGHALLPAGPRHHGLSDQPLEIDRAGPARRLHERCRRGCTRPCAPPCGRPRRWSRPVLLELTAHMINSGAGRDAIRVPDRRGPAAPAACRLDPRPGRIGADLAALLAAPAARTCATPFSSPMPWPTASR